MDCNKSKQTDIKELLKDVFPKNLLACRMLLLGLRQLSLTYLTMSQLLLMNSCVQTHSLTCVMPSRRTFSFDLKALREEGASTASGRLFQWLITTTVKKEKRKIHPEV